MTYNQSQFTEAYVKSFWDHVMSINPSRVFPVPTWVVPMGAGGCQFHWKGENVSDANEDVLETYRTKLHNGMKPYESVMRYYMGKLDVWEMKK